MTGDAGLAPENVQSYPRPPALERVPHRVTVVLGGLMVVDTRRALRVLETHHAPTYYIPREDIDAVLADAPGRSFCEWKGRARYFDLSAGGQTARRAAWTYEAPSARFRPLAGHLALYASLMDRCTVGGVEVYAQPGDFYGGWITPNLQGVVKGGPGTEHW
jgi:uncharacterized protein (DUF427 family)